MTDSKITDERLREALASLIMKHAMKCIVTWKEAIDEAEQFLAKYTAPQIISDEKLRETWEGVKSLIASFEVQAEVRKEDLHNNCPVASYFPIIEAALAELAELRAKCEAMHEAIEVYALPLIWALKCDGKLADGTTAEKVLRAVATPPYKLPTPPKEDL